MSIGEKFDSVMPASDREKARLNKVAEREQKKVGDAANFLRSVIEAYDSMGVRPKNDTIVLYPIIKKARRAGIIIEEKVGSEFMRQQMRENYHLVVDWDKSSEVANGLKLSVGGAVQVGDFPFKFSTPVPLEKKDPSLKGVELYAIRAFEVLAYIDGIRLQSSN